MIRYALKCADDHGFDSWFASAEAYEKLRSSKMVVCPACGSDEVTKAIMAPRVTAARNKSVTERPLDAPASDAEAAVAKIRKEVEQNSDYVGMSFATEARKMHDGESPKRAIYGEARLDEAKKLVDDGIQVVPLPFMSQRKTN